MPSCGYDTEPRDGWQQIVDAWPWQRTDTRAWRKSGACPQCGHGMTVEYSIGIIANLLPTLRRSAPPRKPLARCNCDVEHPGHPAGEARVWGCGQQAPIAPPSA
ncbi:MAG: hypothetical protein WBC33_07610 [Conexibacter sp.]